MGELDTGMVEIPKGWTPKLDNIRLLVKGNYYYLEHTGDYIIVNYIESLESHRDLVGEIREAVLREYRKSLCI